MFSHPKFSFGFSDFRISKSPDFRISKSPDFQILRSPDFQILRYPDFQLKLPMIPTSSFVIGTYTKSSSTLDLMTFLSCFEVGRRKSTGTAGRREYLSVSGLYSRIFPLPSGNRYVFSER